MELDTSNMENNIPKIIHFCWFGGKKLPKLERECIASWRRMMPDYIIKEWNEETFDIENAIPYVREAYNNKKYAFVSDYVRLYALYHDGGIYLDTDVRIIKPLGPILNNRISVMGFESDERLSTAFIASLPKTNWIKALLDEYKTRTFLKDNGTFDMTTNVDFISAIMKGKGLKSNGERQSINDIDVFPSEYFSPKSWENKTYTITENTYCIHYYSGTWHSPIVRFLSFVFSNKTVAKIAGVKEIVIKFLKKLQT